MASLDPIIIIYQELLRGDRSRFPNYLFEGEQGKKNLTLLTRYLIETHLNISLNDIPDRVNANLLWVHRLRPPARLFGWNFTELVQNAYPNQFYPWDFKQVSNGYWKGEEGRQRAIKTVKEMIVTVCQIPYDKIPQQINYHFFKEKRLLGIFELFGHSPFQVVNAVFPNEFHPWQFANLPMQYWKNADNIKQMMDWFLFEKLQYSTYSEAHEKLKKRHFTQHHLTGLFKTAFNMRLVHVQYWIIDQINQINQFSDTTGENEQATSH